MIVRVVIPLNWNSQFRVDLFNRLNELEYKWSSGAPLSYDYSGFYDMAYIAIDCVNKSLTFSRKIGNIEKPVFSGMFNYILTKPNVDNVISTINYIRQLLSTNPTQEKMSSFINSHYELKNLFTIL